MQAIFYKNAYEVVVDKMFNLGGRNSKDIIKVFDNRNVLRQLARTWRYFSDFRVSLTRLEKTEELLSTLSVISSMADIKNKDILSEINTTSPEFIILKELSDVAYKAQVFKKIMKYFGINNIKIDKDYDRLFKNVEKTDIDPILKFVILYSYTFKYCNGNKNLMRIISIFIFKYLKILGRPVLYPLDFIDDNLILDNININSSIAILKTLENICRFGEYTINIIDDSIDKLKHDMYDIKELRKFSNSKYFYYIFSKICIKITDFMKDLNIKRDKAARLLARLVKQGYLKEEKSGKEKIFINVYMLTFSDSIDIKEYIKIM